MKNIYIILGFIMLTPCAGSVEAQTGSSYPAPKVISIDGSDLHRARKVLKNFYITEPQPECYNVLFSSFAGNLRIDFVPKKPDPIRQGNVSKNDIKICGKNVGYVVDRDGNPLRKIYSK